MIRLTEEEIDELTEIWLNGPEELDWAVCLAKAQIKKVFDLGNEECPEHHATYTPKHQCVQCMSSIWQVLLEEVK